MPKIITKDEFVRIRNEIKVYESKRAENIHEPAVSTGINIILLDSFFIFNNEYEGEDFAFPDESYKLISAALYKDIRDLEYFTRHALLSNYDKKQFFDSGSSSVKTWMGGKKNLDEEEKCLILASLFDRLLKKVNFKYETIKKN